MKNLLRIARWEYNTRIRARSFLFNTFISPLLFTAIITLPIFFFQYQPEVSTKLIGLIDLSKENIEKELQSDLNAAYRLKNGSPEYMILQVSLRGSDIYNTKLREQAEFSLVLKKFSERIPLYLLTKGTPLPTCSNPSRISEPGATQMCSLATEPR